MEDGSVGPVCKIGCPITESQNSSPRAKKRDMLVPEITNGGDWARSGTVLREYILVLDNRPQSNLSREWKCLMGSIKVFCRVVCDINTFVLFFTVIFRNTAIEHQCNRLGFCFKDAREY